jgi:transposase
VQQLRQQFRHTIACCDVNRLKFLDESSAQINLTRLYGWAPTAERVVDAIPDQRGYNLTTVATLGLAGVLAAMSFEGAMTGEWFQVYVSQALAPTLQAGDMVVMDNLRAHKVSGIVELIRARGAEVLFLPPYSPDFNPIELCWSKVKATLRKAKARTREALQQAWADALQAVSTDDIAHWFAHRGYCVH